MSKLDNHRWRLVVIMDPVEDMIPERDSTLAILLAAQDRAWQMWYGELKDIWLRDGQAFGQLRSLRVADDPNGWYTLGDVEEVLLSDMDVILMRKDPPFDMEYLVATYILERAEVHGSLVVNRPQSLRDVNEKAFVSWFPKYVPPTIVSRSLDRLRDFIDECGCAIVKPLDQISGRSVFVTGTQDPNRNVVLETISDNGARYVMAQKYVPDIVGAGSSRIFLIDGTPIPYALVRVPSNADHRGNMSAGASVHGRPLTHAERRICEQVGPVMRDKGLLFVGIDVIGEFLTEVNVTSTAGIRELDHACNLQIADDLMQAIEARRQNIPSA